MFNVYVRFVRPMLTNSYEHVLLKIDIRRVCFIAFVVTTVNVHSSYHEEVRCVESCTEVNLSFAYRLPSTPLETYLKCTIGEH